MDSGRGYAQVTQRSNYVTQQTNSVKTLNNNNNTHLMALCPGLPG